MATIEIIWHCSPCTHTKKKKQGQNKEDITAAITEGRYHFGKECEGTVLCRYVCSNGTVEEQELHIQSRKIPLLEVRQSLLERHDKAGLMRQHVRTLEEYASMDRDIISELEFLGEYHAMDDQSVPDADLATRLFVLCHARMLLLSNDHADLLGQS